MELTISEETQPHALSSLILNDYSIPDSELEEEEEIINTLELSQIREIVEAMSKFNQIEILRILHTNDIMINENRYGIHVNLTELKPTIISKIRTYINYVNTQEKQLHKIEQQKETFINTYFQKR
jgi:hypothetical protein